MKSSRFSLPELQSMLAARQSDLASRREALAAELEAVDAELAGTNGSAKRGRKPGKRGHPAKATKARKGGRRKGSGGPRGDGGLQSVIRKVLGAATEPVKLKDLAGQIKKSGYKTTSAKFGVIVGQRLSEMKDVKKAGRGLYTLK